MSGTFALRETGAHVVGQMGGRRLAWMHSTRTAPLFAVMFVQDVTLPYYNRSVSPDHPSNIEARQRWDDDVAAYEVLAAQMTARNLWSRVNMLLVHVEGFGTDRPLWPIWPPERNGVPPPYPSHMHEPDLVVMPWRPEVEIFRLTLEQRGSSVMPQLMYIDAGDNWYPDHLWPGLPFWRDEAIVTPTIRAIRGGRWVDWMIQILSRFV